MLHCSQDSLSENVEVKKLISKNEFRSVLRQAHPKPNTLVNLGNMNFQHYWNPYSHVSMDEVLICFKGRDRNKRWTMAFLWYFLGLCVSNSFNIFNDINPGHITISAFIHQLIVEWRTMLGKVVGAPTRLSSSAD